MPTPNQPRRTFPCSWSSSTTRRTSLAGIEKPIPTLPPVGEIIAVLTPTTFPSMLNSGPPELPRLIGASVWIYSTSERLLMSRLRAEIIPADTVPPKPNGLPIATTQSPIRSASLSAQLTAVNFSPSSASIFKTATSESASRPKISAAYSLPSVKVTVISSASSITWLFVITIPLASTTKPEPKERAWRGSLSSSNRSRNCSQNSPKGLPSGTARLPRLPRLFRLSRRTVCTVEIFTTLGWSFSTRLAKLPGESFATTGFNETAVIAMISIPISVAFIAGIGACAFIAVTLWVLTHILLILFITLVGRKQNTAVICIAPPNPILPLSGRWKEQSISVTACAIK